MTTSSPSTPLAGPRTRASPATRRSSFRPSWTERLRWASRRSARATTRAWSVASDGVELHRAIDSAKDQSYVLGVLTQDQLQRSFFPLGGSLKAAVRAEAAIAGLAVAEKPDSHDICFIADGDTAGFLDRRLGGARATSSMNTAARSVEHTGSHQFTVGQRRGLRLGTPAADGKPRYVLDISPISNTVTVGPRDALAVSRIDAIRPHWTSSAPPRRWSGLVQLRAHAEPVVAHATVGAQRLEMTFGGGRLGCGSRAGRGSLRRDQGGRQRHHRRIPALSRSTMDQELPPIRSTGIGSWPGTDMADAIKIAFAECPDFPYLPELPARGPYAELIGRSTAFLAGLSVDLRWPAGG